MERRKLALRRMQKGCFASSRAYEPAQISEVVLGQWLTIDVNGLDNAAVHTVRRHVVRLIDHPKALPFLQKQAQVF